MYVYVNEKNWITSFDAQTFPNLKKVYIDETLSSYPFKGWKESRLLCYSVQANEKGEVISYFPYVDSRIIDEFEKLENELENARSDVDELSLNQADILMSLCAIEMSSNIEDI